MDQVELGKKELKEFLSWTIKSAEGVASAASDGKINLADLDDLAPILIGARKGLGGIDSVKGQFKAIFVNHRQEICEHIKEEFSIDNVGLESRIERTIELGINLVAVGMEWRESFKK